MRPEQWQPNGKNNRSVACARIQLKRPLDGGTANDLWFSANVCKTICILCVCECVCATNTIKFRVKQRKGRKVEWKSKTDVRRAVVKLAGNAKEFRRSIIASMLAVMSSKIGSFFNFFFFFTAIYHAHVVFLFVNKFDVDIFWYTWTAALYSRKWKLRYRIINFIHFYVNDFSSIPTTNLNKNTSSSNSCRWSLDYCSHRNVIDEKPIQGSPSCGNCQLCDQ